MSNHTVGSLGSILIKESDLPKLAADYSRAVAFFQKHTMRLELPHPGHLQIHNFCPSCGEKVDVVACETIIKDALDHPGPPMTREEYILRIVDFAKYAAITVNNDSCSPGM